LQAIEEAISRGLPRVEAGAQGEHKLQRGYLPNFTYSAHYIADPTMRSAVAKFLAKEYTQVGCGRVQSECDVCSVSVCTLHGCAAF
jgi:predicted N-acyltransferase